MGYHNIIIPLNVRKWTPSSYLKRLNFVPDAKSVIPNNRTGVDTTPPR